MGYYLNPDAYLFTMDKRSKIYVDKSLIIEKLNEIVLTGDRYICISRPRRFGKTMATNMIAAYYENGLDADELFSGMKITKVSSYNEYKNKFDVIKLNMQEFLSRTSNMEELIELMTEDIHDELAEKYTLKNARENRSLSYYLQKAFGETNIPFVLIIDEWDCIFREYPNDEEAQKKYLDFLRDLLKDKQYIALTYMTGALPITNYSTHSALCMFYEFSREHPGPFAEFV